MPILPTPVVMEDRRKIYGEKANDEHRTAKMTSNLNPYSIAAAGIPTTPFLKTPCTFDANSDRMKSKGVSGTSWTDSPHPDSHRGREVDEHMESELADGAKPVSNGRERNAADTDMLGWGSGRMCGDSQGHGQAADGLSEALRCLHYDGVRRERQSEVCGERWRGFPSVSPVHRGNDGLPFDVDRLTLSFGKWRTEALKAYGNAIVPQVMYEIFRAIEEVENQTN